MQALGERLVTNSSLGSSLSQLCSSLFRKMGKMTRNVTALALLLNLHRVATCSQKTKIRFKAKQKSFKTQTVQGKTKEMEIRERCGSKAEKKRIIAFTYGK